MAPAVARLVRAISGGETIVVFGDYDVDGATSAALLLRFFAAVGARASVYVPDRIREGYGPNAPALLRLREEGAAVAVTVDCGATAHEPLAAAKEAGLDVIVVDHHVGEPLLPPAVAVVNPNRVDETSPHGALAAVGVAFLLAVAVNRALREAGWYADAARTRPAAMARPGRARHGMRRRPADRDQPRARRAGHPGRAADAQSRNARAGRGRRRHRRRSTPTISALCSAPGSMPAAGSAPPISAPGCSRPTTRQEAAELAQTLDAYNRERRAIEARDAGGGDRSRRGRPAIARPGIRGSRGLASRGHRHRRGAAQGALSAPGLRRRGSGRDRERVGPLGAGGGARPGGDRGAPGRAARQWRRARDGGRLHGARRPARRAARVPDRASRRRHRPRGSCSAAVDRRRAVGGAAQSPDWSRISTRWRRSAPPIPSRASPFPRSAWRMSSRSAPDICAARWPTRPGPGRAPPRASTRSRSASPIPPLGQFLDRLARARDPCRRPSQARHLSRRRRGPAR